MSLQYNNGIKIMSKWKDGNNGGDLTGALETDFVNTTKACLDRLKELPTGLRLIDEIDQSGHVVEIYRVENLTDGNAKVGRTSDSYMVPLGTVLTKGKTELQRVVATATQDMSDRSAIKKFLSVGKSKPLFLKKDALARLLGISLVQLESMESGKLAITELVEARAKGYLYAFLQPGKGSACYVKFNHKRDNLSPEHKQYLPMSHTYQHRPPAIGLGHELIHAWRTVTGRVLYAYGQEEEAMTVGIPPFTYMEITENQLRLEWGGLAVRPDYAKLQPKTTLLKGQTLGVDDKMNWQGDRSKLVVKTATAKSMESAADLRRKAMGYGDENDDNDSWD